MDFNEAVDERAGCSVSSDNYRGMEYEAHPIAALLPLIEGAPFEALVKSIATDGFDDETPILIYEGKILDGRNRYRASVKAGVQPIFKEWSGGNPWKLVRRG